MSHSPTRGKSYLFVRILYVFVYTKRHLSVKRIFGLLQSSLIFLVIRDGHNKPVG